ncbi:SRPBCC family protein [Georgenia sp. Z1344]|uniref:SRPBCC family protein n=1 Tax=Georgenia sp. Z1344 TaxID=3416706 RepID=UPI003CF78143
MPVTDITTDVPGRTMTITAHFDAPVERIWSLYTDPRQLEQVWGPPGYPATFVEHDIRPGGRSSYYMTGPDGERYGGWWEITAVDEPNGFEFRDGFADADLRPVDSMPVSRNVYRFEPDGSGTTVTATATYESEDALRTVMDMGQEEGVRESMNQIDDFLATR